MKKHLIFFVLIGCPLFNFAQEEIFKKADSLSAFGNRAEAIKILQEIEPKSTQLHLKLARLYEGDKNFVQADRHYQSVLDQNPNRTLVAMQYGEMLLEAKQFEKAEDLFQNLTSEFPKNAALQYRLGLSKENLKDSLAIQHFFKTIELDSSHQAALYKTALYHLQMQNPHEAIALSEKGLEYNENNTSLLSILGQAYHKTFQFEKATDPLERLVELDKAPDFILNLLAQSYLTIGQNDNAISTYLKILEQDNLNAHVHYQLGLLYYKKGSLKDARQHFNMALTLRDQPLHREFLNLGITEKDLKEYKAAYDHIKLAIKEEPGYERAWLELALTADAMFDDKKHILKHYEDYLERFEEKGLPPMVDIARYRVSQLKKEIHLGD